MIDVTTRGPELTRMAQEHAALWQRYYDMYRKLNGAGPSPREEARVPPEPPRSAEVPKSP